MIKKVIILFLFFQLGFGQKKILDSIDDSYFRKYELFQSEKLDLKNLKKTQEDFYFRLSFNGTKIDYWKDSLNQNNGFVTKFIFRRKGNKIIDTIVKKYSLNANQLQKLETLNEFSGLDSIPDDSKIAQWRFGCVGTTYIFENATKNAYSVKSYWEPKSQDTTLLEAKKINDFIDEFLNITENESLNQNFQKDLPNGYTYSSFGTMFYKLYNSSISFDYLGDYRLPYGFSSYYYVNKIAKKRFNLGASINYQVGFNGNSSVKTSVNKYNIFSDNKSYSDVIRFS